MTAGGPLAGTRTIVVVGLPGADVEALAGGLAEVGVAVHVAPGLDARDLGTDAVPPAEPEGPQVPGELRAMTPAPVVVLAWRSPEAAVATLAAEGVAPAHAVALWEASLVHALRDAHGLPFVGVDLDRPAAAFPRVAELLTGLGIVVPAGAVEEWIAGTPGSTAPTEAFAPDPETAALIAAIAGRLAPVLAAAAAVHDAGPAAADLAVGPTSAAILAAHRAAHRSAVDAAAAWAATHEAEAAARDAKAAVEREHRELVGPDPMHYRELRRELWRLRDEFAGIVAGRTNYHTAWMRADAERLVAEQRVIDLLGRVERAEADVGPVRAQRDAMLSSRRWWLGGLVTRPLARLRGRTPPS